MSVREGIFQHGNGNMYTKTWTPNGQVRAKLIFVHGFNEHINRYNDFFPKLTAHGIQVYGWDQRGWGRSVTKACERGLTGPTQQVVADVAAFVRDKLPSPVPVFVMGHSMGGGEILTMAGDAQHSSLTGQMRGWILECPLIGFPAGQEPNTVKVLAGRLVSRLLPRQQLHIVVPPEHLSRDAAVVESVRKDPLCHNTGTLEGLASLLDRTEALSSGQIRLSERVRSILLAHGTQDVICSQAAAIKFMESQQDVRDKTIRTYDGAYHQLHADNCKDEFARHLVDWILERCVAPQPEAKL
ncbi:hypothetical protein CDD83_6186 [Cordyceps sp. RAO-2017]|nr:hypothetical protein CDD83_6186 [Cordyceps sp. RAO-2017]